jgi:predicted glutamine amidotransferase
MCRPFGLAAGREPITATFWLLEAPDSPAKQSRRNPDGYGLATLEDLLPKAAASQRHADGKGSSEG